MKISLLVSWMVLSIGFLTTSANAQSEATTDAAPSEPLVPPAESADAPPAPAAPEQPAAEARVVATNEATVSPPAEAKPKPPPYSLPFQLRGVIPVNVVRSDSTLGLYKNAAGTDSGSVVVSTLLASYKLSDEFSPIVRLGVVSNSPPSPASAATNLMNPVVGALYGLKLSPELRLGFFLGITVPIGGGGGNAAAAENKAANAAGIAARNAMDNAMFAVNDFTVLPGVDLAFIKQGFTAQVEATLLQLTRVRGDDRAQPDSSRTNFTAGLHLGYFLIPQLSLGAEIRHQRWLSTPKAVETNSAARDTTTFAVGPRVHLKLGEKTWLRPGVSFSMPIDKPYSDLKYKNVQLDIPFVF